MDVDRDWARYAGRLQVRAIEPEAPDSLVFGAEFPEEDAAPRDPEIRLADWLRSVDR